MIFAVLPFQQYFWKYYSKLQSVISTPTHPPTYQKFNPFLEYMDSPQLTTETKISKSIKMPKKIKDCCILHLVFSLKSKCPEIKLGERNVDVAYF